LPRRAPAAGAKDSDLRKCVIGSWIPRTRETLEARDFGIGINADVVYLNHES